LLELLFCSNQVKKEERKKERKKCLMSFCSAVLPSSRSSFIKLKEIPVIPRIQRVLVRWVLFVRSLAEGVLPEEFLLLATVAEHDEWQQQAE